MNFVLFLKQEKKFLIFLFIFSFVVRALLFGLFLSQDENYWNADSPAYHEIAIQISNGNGITNSGGVSDFYRLPGYPLFLAAFYKLFDFDIIKTLWMQIFFACIIPILIFVFSLVLFPKKILLAKIASFYSVVHVGFIIYSGLLMTETFFMIFFLLFYILFFSKYWFLSGICLGLASFFRPVGHYVVFLSILLILFLTVGFYQKFKSSILLFLGWFLIVGGWLLRNYLLTGFIFFTTLPGKHFLNHSASYVVMKSENVSYIGAKDILSKELTIMTLQEENKLGRKLNAIEACNLAEKLSWKHHLRYPFLFLKFGFYNILKTSFNLYSEGFSFIEEDRKLYVTRQGDTFFERMKNILLPKLFNKWLRAISYLEFMIYIFILIGFCGFALSSLIEKNNLLLLSRVFIFIVLFIFLTIAAGFARLRLPIEPFLIILSFNFWLTLFKKKALHHV